MRFMSIDDYEEFTELVVRTKEDVLYAMKDLKDTIAMYDELNKDIQKADKGLPWTESGEDFNHAINTFISYHEDTYKDYNDGRSRIHGEYKSELNEFIQIRLYKKLMDKEDVEKLQKTLYSAFSKLMGLGKYFEYHANDFVKKHIDSNVEYFDYANGVKNGTRFLIKEFRDVVEAFEDALIEIDNTLYVLDA